MITPYVYTYLLLPFLYKTCGEYFTITIKKQDDKILFKTKIYYQLGPLTYEIIEEEYDSEQYTKAQVIDIIKKIIQLLNIKFKTHQRF